MFALSALGAPILDQSAPEPTVESSWGGGLGCPCVQPGDYFDVAQTFTVGITGYLTGLDLYINSNPGWVDIPLTVEIRTTASGLPAMDASALLFSHTFPGSGIPGPDSQFFAVSLPVLEVVAGQVLAFVLHSPGGNFGFGGQPNNPYAGGSLWGRRALSSPQWSTEADPFNGDIAFRTFVEPAHVPEPGVLLLLACGMVATIRPLVGGRRRAHPGVHTRSWP